MKLGDETQAKPCHIADMSKQPKRPRDPNQLAKLIADIATGEISNQEPLSEKAKAGQKGGIKGGAARAAALSPEDRKASAQKAAEARWSRNRT